MRWAMALGWLLVVPAVRAEAPMDLDSPFLKTALVQEKTGEITEKTIRKGKRNGALLELEKEEGGLLILPSHQVLAVLPRLPQAGATYHQSDAQRALVVLQQARETFPQRPEVRENVLVEWSTLAAATTQQDRAQTEALEAWLQKCSRLSSEAKAEDLETIRAEGAGFLVTFPDRAKEIQRELAGLKELGAIDLSKVDPAHSSLGGLGNNPMVGAGLWALLLVPLGVVLKAFSDALRGFRQGAFLAGILRLLVGGAAAGFLAAILMGGQVENGSIPSDSSVSTVARRAAWHSLNVREQWASQNPKTIPVPAADWLLFLRAKTVEGERADTFPYWHLGRPNIAKRDSTLEFRQPVQAFGITLPFSFRFAFPMDGQSLTNLDLQGASIGKIKLGAFLGNRLWSLFQPAYQPWAEVWGLQHGVRWLAGEGDTVVVDVPRTQKPKPQAKESLSAQELASIFEQGFGEIYEGKVITVEGALVEVSSLQETLGSGTKLEKQDPMDEFTMEGIPEGPGRRYALRVRGQFKSPDAYFLDTKGDLFRSTPQMQNPSTDIPILRRLDGITKVRMSSGRVESKPSETRLITLYDCRKVEGFDGKEWKVIWAVGLQP